MRVCQFRHDGNRIYLAAAAQKPPIRKTYISILQPDQELSNRHGLGRDVAGYVSLATSKNAEEFGNRPRAQARSAAAGDVASNVSTESTTLPYSSFAVIVIFAFRTFDTGQPFSAASAHF
jgi:hypothetical protein